MNTTFTPIGKRHLSMLRAGYEKRRRSHWAGNRGFETPRVLPWKHGDGRQAVALSFYNAPECVLVCLVDSSLPLEMPLEQRCATPPADSFRELLDRIYDLAEDNWSEPPVGRYRLRQLKSELKTENPGIEADDLPSLWSLVIDGGGTWATF